MESQKLLSIRQVQEILGGLSRATVYRLVRQGSLVRPKKVSARRVAWPAEEIERYLATRPRAGDDDDA